MIEEKRSAAAENERRIKNEMLDAVESWTLVDVPGALVESVRAQKPECTDEVLLKTCKTLFRKMFASIDASEVAKVQYGIKTVGRMLDDIFIKEVNGILPPVGCAGTLYDRIWDFKLKQLNGTCKSLISDAKKDAQMNWKVNRTMYDPIWTDHNDGLLSANVFNPVEDIGTYFLGPTSLRLPGDPPNKRIDELNFFEISTLIFWDAARSLFNLTAAGSLSFELSSNSVTEFCRKIRDQESRQHPIKFHRIFLSNIPDYIGMLSVFTVILPLLHRPSRFVPTFIQSNVLFNTGLWSSYSHYIYSSTGIPDFFGAERLLGIRFLTMDSVWEQQNQYTWSDVVRPQASREELTLWLHRVLLFSLLPPMRDPYGSWNEECPMNFASFLRLCTFCVETLGYPIHWVGGVVDDVLAACSGKSTLKTKAEFPSSSPITFSGKTKLHRVDLQPFRIEVVSQIKIWCSLYGDVLIPTTGLSFLGNDRCNKYRLSLTCLLAVKGASVDGAGGLPQPMCLGFVLSDCKNPDGAEDRLTPFLSSMDAMQGRIRSDALTKGSKGPMIFSCLGFNCNLPYDKDHSIEFYMSQSSFEVYSDYYISLIRTDSWNQLGLCSFSQQMRLSNAVLVE
jgi:hypothetical protein